MQSTEYAIGHLLRWGACSHPAYAAALGWRLYVPLIRQQPTSALSYERPSAVVRLPINLVHHVNSIAVLPKVRLAGAKRILRLNYVQMGVLR